MCSKKNNLCFLIASVDSAVKTALSRESGTIDQSGHKHKPDCARPTDMTDFDKESQVNPETESRTTGNTEPEPRHEPKPRTRAESETETRDSSELEPETDEHIDITKLEPRTEYEPMTDSGPLTRAEDKSKASTRPVPRATEHDSGDNSETETTVEPEPMLSSKKISGPKAGRELQTEKDEKDLQEGNLYLTSLKYCRTGIFYDLKFLRICQKWNFTMINFYELMVLYTEKNGTNLFLAV